MKRLLVIAAVSLFAACSLFHHDNKSSNPYSEKLFIEQFLNPSDPLDQRIAAKINQLRANPNSAVLHNDLGSLLSDKGYPKDAQREFERAVNADAHYFPAWYNLGLMRAERGDYALAHHAFERTIHYKPGHAAALFQLGLLEERAHNNQAAINYYAKAYRINHALLDVRVNPRVVDSKLVHLALMKAYTLEHTAESVEFQANPQPWEGGRAPLPTETQPTTPQAPSPQATPEHIVTPVAPVTAPAVQKPPVTHT
jgi:tetratricopeptide (TPR) repeat protein